MRKFLLIFAALLSAAFAKAEFLMTVNGNSISHDTTINVTNFELDPILGTPTMGFEGNILYYQMLNVYIERSSAGLDDQLCAGACATGNGELRDTMDFNLSFYQVGKPIQLYSHYSPAAPGTETIKYTFHTAESNICLTVNYIYNPTALEENKCATGSVKSFRNGKLVISHKGNNYDASGKVVSK